LICEADTATAVRFAGAEGGGGGTTVTVAILLSTVREQPFVTRTK
jgi:hypothetical protein